LNKGFTQLKGKSRKNAPKKVLWGKLGGGSKRNLWEGNLLFDGARDNQVHHPRNESQLIEKGPQEGAFFLGKGPSSDLTRHEERDTFKKIQCLSRRTRVFFKKEGGGTMGGVSQERVVVLDSPRKKGGLTFEFRGGTRKGIAMEERYDACPPKKTKGVPGPKK